MEGPDRIRPRRWFGLGHAAVADRADRLRRQGLGEIQEIAEKLRVHGQFSGAVPRFVADGETSMGLTLEDNALEYVQGGAPICDRPSLATARPRRPTALRWSRAGPIPEGGKKFIDWALSKSTQDTLATKIGRRSVRTDASNPAGTPALSEVNMIKPKPLADFGGTEAVLAKWRTAIGE
jgi:iron(III) transport system substrate-binding protein